MIWRNRANWLWFEIISSSKVKNFVQDMYPYELHGEWNLSQCKMVHCFELLWTWIFDFLIYEGKKEKSLRLRVGEQKPNESWIWVQTGFCSVICPSEAKCSDVAPAWRVTWYWQVLWELNLVPLCSIVSLWSLLSVWVPPMFCVSIVSTDWWSLLVAWLTDVSFNSESEELCWVLTKVLCSVVAVWCLLIHSLQCHCLF